MARNLAGAEKSSGGRRRNFVLRGVCEGAEKNFVTKNFHEPRRAHRGDHRRARGLLCSSHARQTNFRPRKFFAGPQKFWGASPKFSDEPKVSRGPRRAHRRDRGARATTARAPLMFFALLRKFSQKLFSFPLELFLPRNNRKSLLCAVPCTGVHSLLQRRLNVCGTCRT